MAIRPRDEVIKKTSGSRSLLGDTFTDADRKERMQRLFLGGKTQEQVEGDKLKSKYGLDALSTLKSEIPDYYQESMFQMPGIDLDQQQRMAQATGAIGQRGYAGGISGLENLISGLQDQPSLVDRQQQIAAENIRQQMASAAATGGYDPAKQRSAMYGTSEALANLGAQSELAKIQEEQSKMQQAMAANQALSQLGLAGEQAGANQFLQQALAEYQGGVGQQQALQDYAGKQTARDLAFLDYIQGRGQVDAEKSGWSLWDPGSWFD